VNKDIKNLEKEIETLVKDKKENLTKEEIKELFINKAYEEIKNQLERYLNDEKKKVINIFENLYNKYKYFLLEIDKGRQERISQLNEFLKELGYTTNARVFSCSEFDGVD